MSDTAVLDPPKPARPSAASQSPPADPDWVTAEQVAAMASDYPRTEIWYGELRVKMASRPNCSHGEVQARLLFLLGTHVYPKKTGSLFAESGTLLRREPDVLFGPDVGFYVEGRGKTGGTFFADAPDLAVEILSPSNSRRAMQEKVDIYFRYGSRLVWIVDPLAQNVTVHTPEADPAVLTAADTLTGGDVLPGFSVKVAELFGT